MLRPSGYPVWRTRRVRCRDLQRSALSRCGRLRIVMKRRTLNPLPFTSPLPLAFPGTPAFPIGVLLSGPWAKFLAPGYNGGTERSGLEGTRRQGRSRELAGAREPPPAWRNRKGSTRVSSHHHPTADVRSKGIATMSPDRRFSSAVGAACRSPGRPGSAGVGSPEGKNSVFAVEASGSIPEPIMPACSPSRVESSD